MVRTEVSYVSCETTIIFLFHYQLKDVVITSTTRLNVGVEKRGGGGELYIFSELELSEPRIMNFARHNKNNCFCTTLDYELRKRKTLLR